MISPRRKAALISIIVLATLALLVLLAVPRLANLDRYRGMVVADIERGTGRSARIGHLALTILPEVSVRADDVAIGNPTGFPNGHFLTANHVYAEISPLALLRGELVIRSLKLEGAAVRLISTGAGRLNSEAPGSPTVVPAAYTQSRATQVSVTKVTLTRGSVTYANLLDSGQVGPPLVEADGVSAELNIVNTAALGVNLALASQARLHPAQPSLQEMAWQVPAFWLVPIDAEAQPRGAVGAVGTVAAQTLHSSGLEATKVSSRVQLYRDGVVLDGVSIDLCGGHVTGDLALVTSPRPIEYSSQVTIANVDVARLLKSFPSAQGKLTGKAEGHLALSGTSGSANSTTPATYNGTGQLTIRDGTLPALQVSPDLKKLMTYIIRTGSASADPSAFRSISADLEVGGGVIRSQTITLLGNGVDMDLSGTLALGGGGEIDYHGVGKIAARRNGYSSVLAGLLGSKMKAGVISFPFTLTGTLAAPRFNAPNSPFLR